MLWCAYHSIIFAGVRLQELVEEHVGRVASDPSDQIDLLEHGSREADRFKRRVVASSLRTEAEKRRKLVNSVGSTVQSVGR